MIVATGLDIETTGLEQSEGHRIIEIAMCLYNSDTEQRIGKYVQRINPQRSISPGAQAVHGISFSELQSEPTWDVVAPKVQKILKATTFAVGHNGNWFDLPFIGMELMRVGLEVPNIKAVDTCMDGRWATPMGKAPNLGELCFACGVEYDKAKAHGAEYDVEVMMKCFFIGKKRGFFKVPE